MKRFHFLLSSFVWKIFPLFFVARYSLLSFRVDKKQLPEGCSIERAVLKKTETLRNTYFQEHLQTAASVDSFTRFIYSVLILSRKVFVNIYDDDDDDLFLWYGWPTKDVQPFFQLGPLSEILTIANLQHAASRIWTCAESEFRLWWMKLCSSDNHYLLFNHYLTSVYLDNYK